MFIQSSSFDRFICKALLLTINISEYKNSDKSSCGKSRDKNGWKVLCNIQKIKQKKSVAVEHEKWVDKSGIERVEAK